ncbi:MAG: hypothetical protein Q9164_002893 [Protoblastenia rupestris]
MSINSPPSALPIIDLAPLCTLNPSTEVIQSLSQSLSDAFSTTGFAYLINSPISLDHTEIFALAHSFFSLSLSEKNMIAKKSFCSENSNTYHGYFPAQAGSDNLKEGFEIGPPDPILQIHDPRAKISLTEPNVWPTVFLGRQKAERLHRELQTLSQRLLSLLAIALGKPLDYFSYMHPDSISTLRLLHYPATSHPQEFCCTPHTDSGILTLLHQDSTGGLEVLSQDHDNNETWLPAPYVPGSIVVNIGDLMSKVSGGRFKATYHRVRSSPGRSRYSVPFFFEPGVGCLVKSAVEPSDPGVLYGEHVLGKMRGWVEFQDLEKGGLVVESVEEVGEVEV